MLTEDVNTFTFALTRGGQLPRYIIGGLTTPEAFQGDYTLCPTNYAQHHLASYDIKVDNTSLPGLPIRCSTGLVMEPYVQFLKTSKWFQNNFAGLVLTEDEFNNSNFLMCYDLTTIKDDRGWLSMKLDFDSALASKLLFVYLLIFDKNVAIHKDNTVFVTN
jgi:hypothetical protein